MSNITMSQIAEVAEVSQATVSFVLNGRQRTGGSISENTAQRVRQVAQELGYRPNRAARALATGKSNLIGLAMWNLSTAHYAGITRRVEEELQGSQKHLLVSCLRGNRAEGDPQLLESTFPWPLDGVLVLEAANVLNAHYAHTENWPAPIVSMGGMYFRVNNLDYVGVDLAVGVRDAVNHLVEIGCQRIVFAGQKGAIDAKELRVAAYEQALHEHGKEAKYVMLTDNSRGAARGGIKAYAAQNKPDGILCFNDEVALGCYRGLRDIGMKVPQQVALVGCDGIEDTEYLDYPITTIVQPIETMCHEAWDILRKRIKDPQRPFQQKVLLPQLAVRESTSYFGENMK